ncbi:MAG: dihydropteroate synthase [Actinomycetota bacterium]|nr:dihydropteroate synthase [Actinomycetota bacterium]
MRKIFELSLPNTTMTIDHCLVMGIVNRTPDSFYDGGRMGLDEAVAHALTLVEEGAEMLDLGAVKAGPGAPVWRSEEIDRLIPLVEAVAARTTVPLSVETADPVVARRAIGAGASVINDVTALANPELASAAADTGAALILMHNGGQIRGRPRNPRYPDVVQAVEETWDQLCEVARGKGVDDSHIVLDPGLDFGKTTFHSLALVRALDRLTDRDLPVLVAASRKDIVGETLAAGVEDRLHGSVALAVLSAHHGAAIVRVHDVRATVDAVRMAEAVDGSRRPAAPIRGLWD